MLSERDLSAAIRSTAYGTDGHRIGTVEHFFVDDRTGTPSWVAVTTGLFGTRHSIAPVGDATFADGDLRLPVTADAVKAAPRMAGEHLDREEEAALRSHYGVGRPAASDERMSPDGTPAPSAAPAAGTRMRLVKYVVTEEVQLTVPVRREEIRVEEVPHDAPDEEPGESLLLMGDGSGRHREPEIAGVPDEIVLHAERPVVTVEVVPIERVRLRTERAEGTEAVTGQVQRERVEVDQDGVTGA